MKTATSPRGAVLLFTGLQGALAARATMLLAKAGGSDESSGQL
jgi:hypothetical protein